MKQLMLEIRVNSAVTGKIVQSGKDDKVQWKSGVNKSRKKMKLKRRKSRSSKKNGLVLTSAKRNSRSPSICSMQFAQILETINKDIWHV